MYAFNDSIEFRGETKTLTEWANQLDMKPVTLWQRFRAGWDTEKALTTAVNTNCRSKGERHMHGLFHKFRAEYRTWLNMKTRCENPNNHRYAEWGGRGIVICERWSEFSNFIADMGPRPSSKHQIDRIDNDGPYSPENCQWATRTTQARNTSASRYLTWNGQTKTAAEWAEITGMRSHLILSRIDRYGWTVEQALSTPARKMDGPKLKSYKPNPLNNS